MGFLLWFIPNTNWTMWWVVERRASEKYSLYMVSSDKKSKRNLSESDKETEEVCQAKFSLFFVEEVIATRATPKTVKKTRNGNLLVKMDSQRQVEIILKIKTFNTTKYRVYLHEKLPMEFSGVGSWLWLQKGQ